MSYRPILVLLKAIVTGVFPHGEHLILGNPEFSRICDRQLEIVSHEYGVNRAHFLAIPAVNAQSPIDHVVVHDLFVLISLGGYDRYGLGGAYFSAQAATHTAFLSILMALQDLCPAKTIGNIVIDFRVSEGHRLGEEIADGEGKPLDKVCLKDVRHQTHCNLPFI
jgi:hypothetical protein